MFVNKRNICGYLKYIKTKTYILKNVDLEEQKLNMSLKLEITLRIQIKHHLIFLQ